MSYAIDASLQDGLVTASEIEWPAYVGRVSTPEDASRFDQIARRYANDLINQAADREIVKVKVSFVCVNESAEFVRHLASTSRFLSREIAVRRGIEIDGAGFQNISDDVVDRMSNWTPGNSECSAPTLKVEQSLTPSGLLSVAGLWNAIYASFERTLYDFYTNIGFKLAPYAYVDPENDIGNFYASLINQTKFGLLGLSYGDPNIQYALGEFSYRATDESEKLHVPFSPMLASSLTVSALFWIYIGVIYTSRISVSATRVFVSMSDKIDLKSAPFTFLSIGAGLGALAAYICVSLADLGWSTMFGSVF